MKKAEWETALRDGCFITSNVDESIEQVAALLAEREREARHQGMFDAAAICRARQQSETCCAESIEQAAERLEGK